METEIRYRGRVVTASDIAFIERLIRENPEASRRSLSLKLCKAWSWVQPNRAPRDIVARGLMLLLHREGHIQLPPKRHSPPNNLALHRSPPRLSTLCWDPVPGPLSQIRPLELRQVRRTGEEALFDSLIETYHYLGYTRPVGEHLKFVIYAGNVPVACMALCSAPRHIGCRDRFIGWSPAVRRKNLHLIAYQPRFLVLPWASVKYLASHILGRMARRISADWQAVYHHPIYFLETFVDTGRFRGTCYRAANWVFLGLTTGRGKADQTKKPNRSLKQVWGYPLRPDFRERLCAVR